MASRQVTFSVTPGGRSLSCSCRQRVIPVSTCWPGPEFGPRQCQDHAELDGFNGPEQRARETHCTRHAANVIATVLRGNESSVRMKR